MRESEVAAEKLRGEIAALEIELAGVQQERARLQTEMMAAEQVAMAAIQAGDTVRARTALLEMHPHIEAAALLDADGQVLQAMLDECREFMQRVGEPRNSSLDEKT